MSAIIPSDRVVIIGAGNVGASAAYSIISQDISKEIILIDINQNLANSQMLDLQDSSNFSEGSIIKTANYSDITEGDIIVITCGATQKEGQTRLDLLNINIKIIKDVISKINQTGKMVYILMVTNPVDILTYFAVKESSLPQNLIFGSGTFLDSVRLRVLLSQELKVSTANVHSYVLGEHGDSSFPALESTSIGGASLSKFFEINDELYNRINSEVRDKAYEIIQGKGATYYGIGSAVARIIKSIIKNEQRISPLSIVLNGEYGLKDLAIGVPAIIGSNGAKVFNEVRLNNKEREMFLRSAEVIKKSISEIENSI